MTRRYFTFFLIGSVILSAAFLVLLFLFSTNKWQKSEPIPASNMLFGMRFPPENEICDYSVVTFWWNDLLQSNSYFNPTVLDIAKSCGTKVLVRLSGKSTTLMKESGFGLDLAKYEQKLQMFAGKLEPYISNGTIFAHLTIDEPQDCKNDWGGVCPTFEEIEEAGRISKKYWPNLPTMINTIPSWALSHTWKNIDYIHFQYAFHKGHLVNFIEQALEVYTKRLAKNISWSFQVVGGGCSKFGECNMVLNQIVNVGRALCDTKTGLFVSFSSYKSEIMTKQMKNTVLNLKKYCENSKN